MFVCPCHFTSQVAISALLCTLKVDQLGVRNAGVNSSRCAGDTGPVGCYTGGGWSGDVVRCIHESDHPHV